MNDFLADACDSILSFNPRIARMAFVGSSHDAETSRKHCERIHAEHVIDAIRRGVSKRLVPLSNAHVDLLRSKIVHVFDPGIEPDPTIHTG